MYQSRELFLFTAWGKDLQQAAIIYQGRIQEKRLWRGANIQASSLLSTPQIIHLILGWSMYVYDICCHKQGFLMIPS